MKIKKEFWLSPYFIVTAVALLFSVLSPILLAASYYNSKYMSWAAFALSFVGIAAFCALFAFKQTEKYAAIALFAFNFAAFLLYIDGIYMYLSDVFYSGVTAEAFKNMDLSFVFCTLFFLLAAVISNVSVWLKIKTGRNREVESAKGEQL